MEESTSKPDRMYGVVSASKIIGEAVENLQKEKPRGRALTPHDLHTEKSI